MKIVSLLRSETKMPHQALVSHPSCVAGKVVINQTGINLEW